LDIDDDDRLTHLDPISSLEAFVDNRRSHDHLTEETIREMGTITIHAYRRRIPSLENIEDAIDCALESARESIEDYSELGEPDGSRPMFTIDALAKHRPAFEAAVRGLLADAVIWRCDSAATFELTPAETIEILLVERPEWFVAPAPATPPEVPA
jgi:hypothetical protein